jgi:hypothetical protein
MEERFRGLSTASNWAGLAGLWSLILTDAKSSGVDLEDEPQPAKRARKAAKTKTHPMPLL